MQVSFFSVIICFHTIMGEGKYIPFECPLYVIFTAIESNLYDVFKTITMKDLNTVILLLTLSCCGNISKRSLVSEHGKLSISTWEMNSHKPNVFFFRSLHIYR